MVSVSVSLEDIGLLVRVECGVLCGHDILGDVIRIRSVWLCDWWIEYFRSYRSIGDSLTEMHIQNFIWGRNVPIRFQALIRTYLPSAQTYF